MNWEEYKSRNLPVVKEYDHKYEDLPIDEVEKLCTADDPVAYFELARRYRKGQDVEADYGKMKDLYIKGLEFQKDITAMYWLGRYYKWEAKENKEECFKYFEYGSELGDGDCTADLANLYRYGDYVEASADKATELYELAIEQGNAFSWIYRGEMHRKKDEDAEAFECFKKCYDITHEPLAAYYMGDHYYHGYGMEQDDDKAFKYLKEASDGGLKLPNYMLGVLYGYGTGVEQDLNKAFEYLNDVDEDDLDSACTAKGRLYYKNGDYENAYTWTKKGADMGNKNAIKDLEERFNEDGTPKLADNEKKNDADLSQEEKMEILVREAYNGNVDACIFLAKLLCGDFKDYEKVKEAADVLEIAAKKDDLRAVDMLIATKAVFAAGNMEWCVEINATYDEAAKKWKEMGYWYNKLRELTEGKPELSDKYQKAVDGMKEAKFYCGVATYCADDKATVYNMFKGAEDMKSQVLCGVSFDIENEDDLTEAYLLLHGVETKEYFSDITYRLEERVGVFGALRIALYYRLVKEDLTAAVSSLTNVLSCIKNEIHRSIIEDEIGRYKKKFFGGYTYVE